MFELTIDIETIPTQDEAVQKRIAENIKPPGNIKKQESLDAWYVEKGEAAAWEQIAKTALDGTHGEVLFIGYAINDDDPVGLIREIGDPEADLLSEFYRKIKEATGQELLQLIGHNYLKFDSRFLYQRSVIQRIRPSFSLNQDRRYNDSHTFDTMLAWAGWGNYVKLATICNALGIPVKQNGMTGADVYRAALDGRYDDIAEYGTEDVAATRDVFKRLTFQA